MKEVCSCGAKFECVRVESMTIQDDRLERVYQMLLDWRANHRHEIDSPGNGDISMIVESSSSHERATPFGFAPEPEGGWYE